MTERRQCTGTTRKGTPCKAHPLHGTDKCMAHSPATVRESVGFIAANGKAGRKPKPTAADFLREWWDENEGRLLEVLSDALEAERAVVVGSGDNAMVEMVPDSDLRLKAFREALDRYFGKPKQSVDVGTGGEGGMGAALIIDAELAADARALLRRAASPSSE